MFQTIIQRPTLFIVTPSRLHPRTSMSHKLLTRLLHQANIYVQYANCLSSAGGGQHPGHSVEYLVDAGTNATFYYAVTIEWDDDGTTVVHQELDPDVSSLTIGVEEVTSPVETPLYFQASYSLADSETTLTWINYHSPNLPNTDPALPNTTILVWRSTAEISRSNGGLVYQGQTVATLIANISSDLESYVHTVLQTRTRKRIMPSPIFYSKQNRAG